ncbi:MAG TPA: SDR family NAD(P)-dependent oxidoreductase, partial [Acidiphilium sp.]
MTDPTLAGKTAIVTGGASGIGRAIAASLAVAGASVIICGRDAAKLATAAQKIGSDRIFPVTADITREADVDTLFAGAKTRFGDRLDILVNNA